MQRLERRSLSAGNRRAHLSITLSQPFPRHRGHPREKPTHILITVAPPWKDQRPPNLWADRGRERRSLPTGRGKDARSVWSCWGPVADASVGVRWGGGGGAGPRWRSARILGAGEGGGTESDYAWRNQR
jgi:hypothetical protein